MPFVVPFGNFPPRLPVWASKGSAYPESSQSLERTPGCPLLGDGFLLGRTSTYSSVLVTSSGPAGARAPDTLRRVGPGSSLPLTSTLKSPPGDRAYRTTLTGSPPLVPAVCQASAFSSLTLAATAGPDLSVQSEPCRAHGTSHGSGSGLPGLIPGCGPPASRQPPAAFFRALALSSGTLLTVSLETPGPASALQAPPARLQGTPWLQTCPALLPAQLHMPRRLPSQTRPPGGWACWDGDREGQGVARRPGQGLC